VPVGNGSGAGRAESPWNHCGPRLVHGIRQLRVSRSSGTQMSPGDQRHAAGRLDDDQHRERVVDPRGSASEDIAPPPAHELCCGEPAGPRVGADRDARDRAGRDAESERDDRHVADIADAERRAAPLPPRTPRVRRRRIASAIGSSVRISTSTCRLVGVRRLPSFGQSNGIARLTHGIGDTARGAADRVNIQSEPLVPEQRSRDSDPDGRGGAVGQMPRAGPRSSGLNRRVHGHVVDGRRVSRMPPSRAAPVQLEPIDARARVVARRSASSRRDRRSAR
jgi:hypothetical protein